MNLALFDFDGTITSREMFPDFVRSAITPSRLAWGRIVLAPIIAGYKLGLVSGTTVRASIVRVGFRGQSQIRIAQAGERFARDVLPGVLRPHAMERIRWHRQRGDTVVVVSGGFDLYLTCWCRQHGLALLCSALEARDGVLTGRYRGAQCVGAEKTRRIRERYNVGDYPEVYAYGDTSEDADMLALASRKYFRWQEVA